ncbi:MAG: hypothetical protein GX801_09870 [Fibrobacter sp.]|nr:hypothetical protein [Fibrobacter sp.]
MNKRKRSAKKSKTRVAKKATPARDYQWWGALFKDVFAWGTIIFSLIALVASVSRSYGSPEQNVLGPYLGHALAVNLSLLLGKMPLLLYIAALFFTGVWLIIPQIPRRFFKLACAFWVLALSLQILLSLSLAPVSAFSKLHFENYGGIIGIFFLEHLVKPLFHQAMLAPYIILIILMVFAVFWGFGFSFVGLAKAIWSRLKQFKNFILGLVQNMAAPKADLPPLRETSDFPVLRRGKVEPINAEALMPSSGTMTQFSTQSQDFVTTQVPLTHEPTVNLRLAAMAEIEEQLKHAASMDPRKVRALRKELEDLRRADAENQWEVNRSDNIEIKGIVKSDQDSTKTQVADISADPTLPNPTIKRADTEYPDLDGETPIDDITKIPLRVAQEYKIPKVNAVLDSVPEQPVDYSEAELKEMSAQLEQQLSNFKIKGKVTGVVAGPVITRFEIEPSPGVKVARFTSIADDLALALKANSIRVLAPIPGMPVVGIEIPNRQAQIVYCREIIESSRFMPDPYTLQIALGKDIVGNAFVMDLARAPHLLIAGQTGSGKSVCINALMASLLFSKTPDELRMILVDPKVVELKSYENIPHLLHPVITDPETAVQALEWACWEMDRRYDLLAKARVRNISGFNQKIENDEIGDELSGEDAERMPFIVIIVDEFADVIMQAKKEFEDPVIRLAQKARACGIHLVLATQRPSTNVITGVIKANLPSRISFKVASHIDARTVLDHAGAEKLLGRGDMLFRSIDDPEAVRVHGAFLSDDDAENVALSCSEQNVFYPQLDSFSVETEEDGDFGGNEDKDPLFLDALEAIINNGGASTSMLQRRLRVGYARAGRIIDELYSEGFIGPARGSKQREVRVGYDELENLRRTHGY